MADETLTRLCATLVLISGGMLGACTSLPSVKPTDVSPQKNCPVITITTGLDAAAAGGTLQVTTYNLHGIKNLVGLKSDFSSLDGTHVFALQEVVSPHGSCGIPEALSAILPPGTWHVFNYPLNAVRGGWESQTIASRHHIMSAAVIPLAHLGSKNRVALVTRIKTPAGSVVVINTDHEAGFWKGVGYNERRHQLESLRNGIEIIDPTMAIVLTGDFNTYGNLLKRPFLSPSGEVAITRSFFENLGFQAVANAGSTFRSLFVSLRLDHFFVRKLSTLSWNKLTHRTGSDHYPITVVLDFPPERVGAPSLPESP